MSITGLFTALVVGLVIGALGRLVVPGRQRIPIWLTLVIGIVAALVGTVVARLFGIDPTGFSFRTLFIQIAVAALGVFIVSRSTGRHHPRVG